MRKRFLQRIPILSLSVMIISSHANAAETPFPYENWVNKEGKVIEARFERIKDAQTVTIQAKNGGMRYDIKRATLADDSDKKIIGYIEASKKTLVDAKRFEGADIYKAVALGLKADAETAMVGKSLSLDVIGIRVSTDKLSAILELEDGLYARLRVSGKLEFYEINKQLFMRTTAKGKYDIDHYWWYNSGDGAIAEGRLIAQEGGVWKFQFSSDVKLEWERVGVTDGVIITD